MRDQDKAIFADAARASDVWILVRETNPASLFYAGLSGYASKPIGCKPKTADHNDRLEGKDYKLAGLVVSAEIWPDVFEPGKKAKAGEIWRAFAAKLDLDKEAQTPGGYKVDTDKASDHYGCLMLHDQYLFGDYDLFDIILKGQENRNLAAVETHDGESHMRGPRVWRVRNFVNSRIGFDMVQHGGEAQYSNHFQPVHVFHPDGKYEFWDARTTETNYAKWKRKPLTF